MTNNIYLLLGIEEGSPLPEIKKAYARTMASFSDENVCCPCAVLERVSQARQGLSQTFEKLKNPEVLKAYQAKFASEDTHDASTTDKTEYCRPKIGQMLVASGLITLDELDNALEIQKNTKTTHVPLGELLVAAGYITPQQLDYYLRMQKLMKLPPDHPDRWGQRLIELGLISHDQLKVALIEQETTGSTLREALITRGWLTSQLLDKIF